VSRGIALLRRLFDRLVGAVTRALLVGLASILAAVASAAGAAQPQVVGSPGAPWVAEVLGVRVHTTSAEEMRYLILRMLTDRYAADRGIGVSAAEVEAYLAEQRRFMAGRGTPLPASEAESVENRAAREQIARAYTLQRKIDAALYRQYGGRIASQQGGPEPVDAYRRFLEAQAAQGRFRILDPALEAGFWRHYVTDSLHEYYAPGSAAEMQALKALAGSSRTEPFDTTLKLQGVTFRVVSRNDASQSRLEITPSGLSIDNRPIQRTIEGTVTAAEVADLDADGSPEIYVYVTSAGSGSYGSVVAYGANMRKSLSEIYMAPITDHPTASKGYAGHDRFAVIGSTLVRHFPIYKPGDSNASPTGGTRQLQYRLARGEASWLLRLDRIADE
jgi:hypothetical protein